jgi:hypothetical protein
MFFPLLKITKPDSKRIAALAEAWFGAVSPLASEVRAMIERKFPWWRHGALASKTGLCREARQDGARP